MNIILTLTNRQIVRNYLFSSRSNLLIKLKFTNLVIVCDNNTQRIVERVIIGLPDEIKHKIKVIKLDFNFRDNLILRLNHSIFQSGVHSKFVIAKLFRQFSKKEISLIKLLVRLAFYLLTFKNSIFINFIRRINMIVIKRNVAYKLLLDYSRFDLALILSLTDPIDVLVTSFAKANNVKSIGTVRSWDNLTSHGLIKSFPQTFYCHSAAMKVELDKYHKVDYSETNVKVGKSYWLDFDEIKSIKLSAKPSRNRKILYAAMGSYFNPSEEKFLEYLYSLNQKLEYNSWEITVLIHPRFPILESIQTKYSDRINFYAFDFDNERKTQSYAEYLKYLKQFQVVISSGSTVLIDACIVNINTFHVNFELTRVPYWESIHRYLDFRKYYSQFLKISETPIINTPKQFENTFIESNIFEISDFENQNKAINYIMGCEDDMSLIDVIDEYV